MQNEHRIVGAVYEAKDDTDKADGLIRAYLPFIRSKASWFMGRLCIDQDDVLSIDILIDDWDAFLETAPEEESSPVRC